MKDENQKSHLEKERKAKLQTWFRKRWVFPAIYLGVAAVVIASVLWLQNGNESTIPEQEMDQDQEETAYDYNEEAVPAANQREVFSEPVETGKGIEIKVPFYDVEASAEEQESALVFYNNKYYQNQGIDYAQKSGEPFEVKVAMSGNVVKSEKDALLGHVVEIEHTDGVTTIYQSLDDVKVKEGDKVEQGDVIGQAGRNLFNKDAGIHVHFEIRKDGVAVNPIDYFGKTVNAISIRDDVKTSDTEASETETGETEASETTDNENESSVNQEEEQHANEPKDASSAMTNA